MNKFKWWFAAFVMFGLIFFLLGDAVVFIIDDEMTVTRFVQTYLGGSAESMRSAIFGFVSGGLFVHFTRWGAKPNGSV